MPLYPISYPLIVGHRYSWASVEIFLPGIPVPVLGVKSLNYKDSLKPGVMRGNHPNKIGRSRGEADASADIEMYRLEAENLKAALISLGGGIAGYMEVSFNIVAAWAERPYSPVVTDLIEGCRITDADYSNQEGTDLSTVKFTLDVMRLRAGGMPSVGPKGVAF